MKRSVVQIRVRATCISLFAAPFIASSLPSLLHVIIKFATFKQSPQNVWHVSNLYGIFLCTRKCQITRIYCIIPNSEIKQHKTKYYSKSRWLEMHQGRWDKNSLFIRNTTHSSSYCCIEYQLPLSFSLTCLLSLHYVYQIISRSS